MPRLRFSSSPAGCDRRHWLTEDDIRALLSRLPPETYARLRAVHFNDRSRGARRLGYVNMGHREIGICALPPRLSFTRFLVRGQSPAEFGAQRGAQWPALAIRRFMLYDVFLHELGHLQLVNPRCPDPRRRFAMERIAQEFADGWRHTLWAEHFEHPDPVHNAPNIETAKQFQAEVA
jgi:hypothetical protein